MTRDTLWTLGRNSTVYSRKMRSTSAIAMPASGVNARHYFSPISTRLTRKSRLDNTALQRINFRQNGVKWEKSCMLTVGLGINAKTPAWDSLCSQTNCGQDPRYKTRGFSGYLGGTNKILDFDVDHFDGRTKATCTNHKRGELEIWQYLNIQRQQVIEEPRVQCELVWT